MSRGALLELKRLKLLDRRWHATDLNGLSDEILRGKLEDYYNCRAEMAESEARAYGREAVPLAALVSSISARTELESLLTLLLVFSRAFVPDRVLLLAEPDSAMSRASRQALGGPAKRELDREHIAKQLRFLSSLAGFVHDETLVTVPLRLLHTRGEAIPIFYSKDNYRSVLPLEVREHVDAHVDVHPVMYDRSTGHSYIAREPADEPCRAIFVDFSSDPTSSGMSFILSTIDSAQPTDDPSTLQIAYSYDLERPVDKEMFETWKEQSINRTIINRLSAVGKEIALASQLGATYLTESPFESELLALSGQVTKHVHQADAVQFLRVNSPSLALQDPHRVLKLRRRNRRGFLQLQRALLDVATELQGLEGPAFDARADVLLKRLVEPEVRRAETRLARLATRLASVTIGISATVALALLSGDSLPFGAVLGLSAAGPAASTLPTIAEYMSRRRTPEHILWQLHK